MDLKGKGGHVRTIPVPDWVKTSIDSWAAGANITSGPLFRSINKAGTVSRSKQCADSTDEGALRVHETPLQMDKTTDGRLLISVRLLTHL